MNIEHVTLFQVVPKPCERCGNKFHRLHAYRPRLPGAPTIILCEDCAVIFIEDMRTFAEADPETQDKILKEEEEKLRE